MSHATYQRQWAEAVQELSEQVQIEYLPVDAAEHGQPYETGFEHHSLLYIKYMQIYKKLEQCYDQMVHPQKRVCIRKMLETTVIRMLQLKQECIAMNRRQGNHVVPLDEVLSDLKLNPETADWQIPRYFTDDLILADEIEVKEQRILYWLKAFSKSEERDDLADKKDPFQVDITVDQAIRTIQKVERGRIGVQRAHMISDWRRDALRKEERNKRQAEKPDPTDDGFDGQVWAATRIAAHWKRRVDRKRFQRMREEEFQFLGMAAPPPPKIDQVDLAREIRLKRKKMQEDAEEAFNKALVEAEEWVTMKRGPDLKAGLLKARREWILKYRKDSAILGRTGPQLPKDLTEMYEPPPEEPDPAAAPPPKKEEPKKKEVPEDVEVHKVGLTAMVDEFVYLVKEYTEAWETLNEQYNFDQKHDVTLARDEIKDKVEAQLQQEVDELILEELENLRKLYEAGAKKKKEKGGKKKGGKDKKKD